MDHPGTNPQKIAVAIIPARYNSTRLPGKPLLPIAGKPLIVRVAEQARRANTVSRAIVATGDLRIFEAVIAAGFEAVMTAAKHASGTDRIAEVVAYRFVGRVTINGLDHEVRRIVSERSAWLLIPVRA